MFTRINSFRKIYGLKLFLALLALLFISDNHVYQHDSVADVIVHNKVEDINILLTAWLLFISTNPVFAERDRAPFPPGLLCQFSTYSCC